MASSIRVEITFSGLCLFVRESPYTLHVLLPDTSQITVGEKHERITPHRIRARVSSNYLGHEQPEATLETFDLIHADADLSGLAGPAWNGSIGMPSEIGSVVKLDANGKPLDLVEPQWLTGPVKGKLGARLKLPGSTSLVGFNCAEPADRLPIAATVTAIIPSVSPSQFPLRLDPDHALTPVGGLLECFIGNLPDPDWRNPPVRMMHAGPADYNAYGAFYRDTANLWVPTIPPSNKGMDPFTCMTGSGCGSSTC